MNDIKNKMEPISKPSFKLIGLLLGNKTSNLDNQSNIDCGNLWQKFEKDDIFNLIPSKLSNEVYAVYFNYKKDETTPFSYFIGCKVEENTETPSGLTDLLIPPQNYLKIIAKGVMTGCITEAWRTIWSSEVDRKFGFDFEIYDERSQDWNDAEVAIYVSTSDD